MIMHNLSHINLTQMEKDICEELQNSGEYMNFVKSDTGMILDYHHTLGQWIRNKWLWKNYNEYDDNAKHPDDESYDIMIKLHHKLREHSDYLKD